MIIAYKAKLSSQDRQANSILYIVKERWIMHFMALMLAILGLFGMLGFFGGLWF